MTTAVESALSPVRETINFVRAVPKMVFGLPKLLDTIDSLSESAERLAQSAETLAMVVEPLRVAQESVGGVAERLRRGREMAADVRSVASPSAALRRARKPPAPAAGEPSSGPPTPKAP
jgi:hypothetical protein